MVSSNRASQKAVARGCAHVDLSCHAQPLQTKYAPPEAKGRFGRLRRWVFNFVFSEEVDSLMMIIIIINIVFMFLVSGLRTVWAPSLFAAWAWACEADLTQSW